MRNPRFRATGEPESRSLERRLPLLLLCLAVASTGVPKEVRAGAPTSDLGIVLEIDTRAFVLQARDERTGESWGSVAVAVGSPGAPTPRGDFRLGLVTLRPSWQPGDGAVAAGAQREAPSLETPMGVAKIPFASGGAVALHGGGDPYLLGKPVSSGCVRMADADLLRLLAWLHRRGALGETVEQSSGELRRDFVRPARIAVR